MNLRYGNLTVLEKIQYNKYRCKCDCGNITDVFYHNLVSENTVSCGRCNQVSFINYMLFTIGKDRKGNKFIIDSEDFTRIKDYYWMMNSRGYWYANINGRLISMHDLILNSKNIDHKNRAKYDNRKENLRSCSNSENNFNKKKMKGNYTSKYKGVCWDKSRNRWLGSIRVNRKLIRLGSFILEVDAAKAYNDAVLKYCPEFGVLNEI
jgi:hypothetical protein